MEGSERCSLSCPNPKIVRKEKKMGKFVKDNKTIAPFQPVCVFMHIYVSILHIGISMSVQGRVTL